MTCPFKQPVLPATVAQRLNSPAWLPCTIWLKVTPSGEGPVEIVVLSPYCTNHVMSEPCSSGGSLLPRESFGVAGTVPRQPTGIELGGGGRTVPAGQSV